MITKIAKKRRIYKKTPIYTEWDKKILVLGWTLIGFSSWWIIIQTLSAIFGAYK